MGNFLKVNFFCDLNAVLLVEKVIGRDKILLLTSNEKAK